MRRPAKIAFGLVLLVVLGLVVVPMIFLSGGGSYRRAVEAYKRDLIAKGEKLTMAELAPPANNDPKRVRQFMDLMSTPVPTNLPSAMKMIAPGVAAPATAILTPDEMTGYEQNLGRIVNLREILGTNRLGFNVDYSHAPYFAMPHLTKLKAAELLATGTFRQALATNDSAQATSNLLVAVDLVRLFDEDPVLISDLVRIAMENIAANATWEALESGRWSEPQLEELQTKWQGMAPFTNIGRFLRGERGYVIAAIAEFRRTNDIDYSLKEVLSGSSSSSSDNGWVGDLRDKVKDLYDRYPGYWKWRSLWSYDEELFMLQADEAALQCARRAEETSAAVPAVHEFDLQFSRVVLLHSATTNHFRSGMLLSDEIRNCLLRAAGMETAHRLTVTAIALKRYQLTHNAYPASLSELVPQYLSQVPLDFMDGKPLRYKLQPEGNFLLYSVGEDGEDNGGDPTPTTSGNNWLKGRDIVWPRAATAKEIEDYKQAQPKTSGRVPAQ